ncbi:hypothetical protein MPER_01595 [Moniliophthora perniciosa FA553]|nr:hypothetical protein MPER_01595 [Moniliophthora perniciosa FA553]
MGVPTHQPQPHIFMHACAAWGHNKPLITLAILIAEARPNVVQTILTNAIMYPKLLGEFNMLPPERLDAVKERIHILNVGGMSGIRPVETMDNIVSGFQTLYNKSGILKCETSGKIIGGPDFPSPTFAIIDPFAMYAIRGIRAVASPQEVPILSWFTSTAGAVSRFSAPAELGGMSDFATLVDEEVKKSGRSFDEVVDELFNAAKGEAIRIPGYPPIYDYEMTPQAVS